MRRASDIDPRRIRLPRQGAVLTADLYALEGAPLVMFTHGGWMDRHMFDQQIGPLVEAGYQVLLWDVRGHGDSQPRGNFRPSVADMADDLIAVLDDSGHRGPTVLVGQSLGGMIAQHVALTCPERVAGLVTIGAPCINPADAGLARRMAAVWRLSALVSRMVPMSLLRAQLPKGTAETAAGQDYVAKATAGITREEFNWLVAASRAAGRAVAGRAIEIPVLITRGDKDSSGAGRLTAMTADSWVSRDARARYTQIPEAGHQAHQDNPDAFNALLLQFLQEVV